MFALNKSWKVLATRALLSAVIVFNALAPASVSASSSSGEEQTSTNSDKANSITVGSSNAPKDEQTQILSEQIAREAQAQQNQEEKPVRFRVEAEPAIYMPGKPIELRWNVQGMQSETLDHAQVVIHAPEGLLPADANPVYTQDGLVTVPLQSKKESSAWNVSKDAEFPIYIGVDLLVNDDLVASETVMIDQPRFNVEKSKGGNLKAMGGKVEVSVPANAISESLAMDIREPAPQAQPGVSLTWKPLEIIAVGQTSQKNIRQFKTPIEIKLTYDETQIFDWEEGALTIYYYDPDLLDWFPIETTVDTENNTLTAYSDHLTVFDYKANNWQSQMVPTVDAFKVSDFTGAGTYQVSLWTPPGPDGLQPNLTLSYNSQVIDESSAFSQSSWVGMGWDLDTGSITRNMHGTDADNGAVGDDTFMISVGGISGVLLPVSVNGEETTYNTADQAFAKVISNNTSYSFTAWTKDGTKYVFGYPTGTNLSQSCATTQGIPTTWRWSLSSVTDVHGNTLNYAYETERKPNCLNEVAVYPTTITYGNGKYQINFVREARTDYQTSWREAASRTFYGTYRLKEVQIKHNGVNIRRYVMSYAPNNSTNIYPNFNWSAGGKTLTLVGVQEFGSDGSALPAVQFTYGDNMHVTKVNNGQGGQVELEYERWTYFDDINKDLRSLRTVFGQDECIPGVLGTAWTRVGTAGTVKCDGVNPYLQVGNTNNVHTVAERPLPEHMVKPGARYWYFIKGMTVNSTATYPVYGFHHGGQVTTVTSDAAFNNSNPHEVDQRGLEMPVGYNPANTKLRLECRNCFFLQLEFILWPSIYRTTTRTVTIQPTGISSTYTYSYDNAAPNTTDNSAAASYGNSALYTKTLREFRGHAMTQVINPEGLATVNWFYQTDSLKGRAYDTLVMKRDFYDNLDGANSSWSNTGGTLTFTDIYQKHLDNAAQLTNPAANWNVSFARTSATLTSGEVAVAHVRLTGASALGEVGLVSGGQFLGINLGSNTATASNGATLLTAGNFLKDEWYGVMIFPDAANGSRVRIWQLDNPANFGETVVSGVGGGSWTFRDRVYNGTIWLDSYFEGVPYTETITRYNSAVQYDTIASNGIPDLAIAELLPFKDLQVAWNTVAWVEQRNYNGDAKFVGTKQVFTYAPASQYGNLLTQTDYANNNGTLSAYRGAKYEYYPNNTATIYIVALPARQVTLDCTGGTCDFTGLTGKQAEAFYFYDNATTYTASPTKGDLTRQRAWVQEDSYSQASFTYYSNGNLKDQIAYTGYATATQVDDPAGPQTTTTVYDADGYNTYPVLVTNALGQETRTTYDYSFGLPNSLTAPNGALTSATYDGFGRLRTITAPLDGSPTLQVTYYDTRIPFQVDLTQMMDAGASIRLSRFYDGAGRQIQTQTVGAVVNGVQKNIVVDYQYNNVGRLVKQSIPNQIAYNATPAFAAQNLTQSTITAYDILGRTLSVTQPNQNLVTYAYTDLTTTVTDPKLISTTTSMDVWGRTIFVDAPEGPDVTYEYDILGRLLTASRGGEETIIHYDASGRKLNMDDPDMGFWQYQYDALGNLTVQTDSRGCDLSLGHDALNRLITKTSSGAGCNQQVGDHYYYDSDDPATPEYDPAYANQKGYRTYMTDASGSTAWVYDARGRLFTESRIIGSQTYTTSWSYNSADLPATMTYPDNEVLTYGYNSDGSLNSVTSSLGDTYLASTKYDEAARITSLDYGASVLRKTFNYFSFNTATQGGLLNSATTTRLSDQATLQSLAYTYDKNANVETITDEQAGPQTQTFGYDPLNRLTGAAVSGGTDGLYSETYQYDSTSGNLAVKGDLTYSYYDPDHAHAVTSVTSGQSLVNSYRYDENGNMILRNVDGQGYTLEYDAENRLTSVQAASGIVLPTLPATLTPSPTSTPSPTATQTGTPTGIPTVPGAATLVSPSGDIGENTNPTYTWNEVSGATWYYLWVNGPSGNVIQQWYTSTEANCNGTTCSVTPTTALSTGAHTWWIQTNNSAGNGPWSAAMNFSVSPPALPGKATLVLPSGSIATNTPTYTWDQVSGATWYYLAVNGPSGSVIRQWYTSAEANCNGTTCSVTPTTALSTGAHTWWVQTWNSAGTGPWSDAMTFSPTPPGAATLASPSGSLTDPTPVYTWNPVSEATWYYLWVSKVNADGSRTPVITKWYEASLICDASTCAVEDGTILSGGNYIWWVQTWNKAGTGPWSDGLTFSTTATGDPATATLTPTSIPTETPTATETPSAPPTDTVTPSATATETPTFTASATASMTSSPTETMTPTDTPTVTATSTVPVFSQAAFTYDGDGQRVQAVMQTNYTLTTTAFVGNYYEVTGSSVTKYYYAGAQRIAMKKDGALNFLLGDHLGSTSLVVDATGNVVSEVKYKAWGEVRYASGETPTKYQYTGQFSYEPEFGLYFYNARWYDSSLGRFNQPDTIIPEQSQGVQAWDRYAYSNNNPVRYTDPSGHCVGPFAIVCIGVALVGLTVAMSQIPSDVPQTNPADWGNEYVFWGGMSVNPVVDFIVSTVQCATAGCDPVLYFMTAAPGPSPVTVSNAVDDIVPDGMVAVPNQLSKQADELIMSPQQAKAIGDGPDYIVSNGGDVIPVPQGATGPTLTRNRKGFQFTGGNGGNGLDSRVTNVRIMDPTSKYPTGYVSYSNASGQPVNPYTGQTVSKENPWWHIVIDLFGVK